MIKWHKLQVKCLICGEVGPYYYVTKEEDESIPPKVKDDENIRNTFKWLSKHHHNGKTNISTKFIEEG